VDVNYKLVVMKIEVLVRLVTLPTSTFNAIEQMIREAALAMPFARLV